jgi:hypothetical protein
MLNQFVDHTLATRLEDAQAWRAVHYARASLKQSGAENGAVVGVAGAPVIYGGEGIPVNRAISLGMHGPVSENDLDVIEDFYALRHTDTVIDLCPLADASLLRALQGRGYALRGWMNMLFLPLPATLAGVNPALRVSRATPDQAELWIRTSARGFDETDDVAASTLRILAPNFYAENAHCYFAWLNDLPVGTGGMYLHNQIAEFGGASTLIHYRRRGVQGTLLQQRLADAHALGCDIAAVLTTPGSASQRNMQRHNFQLAYTRAIFARPYTR